MILVTPTSFSPTLPASSRSTPDNMPNQKTAEKVNQSSQRRMRSKSLAESENSAASKRIAYLEDRVKNSDDLLSAYARLSGIAMGALLGAVVIYGIPYAFGEKAFSIIPASLFIAASSVLGYRYQAEGIEEFLHNKYLQYQEFLQKNG